MHNPSLLTPAKSSRSQARNSTRMRLIQFRIGTLNLAIRIESVTKILKNIRIDSSGTNSFGVAHLEEGEITIFDLQRQLFLDSAVAEHGHNSHLIVLQSTAGEPYGIPVVDVPILLDLPTTDFRILPESYRRADTLRMATHVAVVDQGSAPETIFLLDTQLLDLARVN